MSLKRKRTKETEVVAVPAVSAVSILANENFTGSFPEALQTKDASALFGSVRGNIVAQSKPMGTASTTSIVPLTEGQASSATMVHIMNARKQDLFETLREQQLSYFRDYFSKHERAS